MDVELLTLSGTFLLMAFKFYECAVNVYQFTQLTELEGFTCSSSENIFRHTFGHPIACLLECAGNTECLSTFYHNGTGKCDGCINMYETSFDENVGNIEPFPGTLHYVKQAKTPTYNSDPISVCPVGWTGWRHSCYKKTNTNGSFEAGVDTCAIDQGHAVFIENTTENDFLQNLFRDQFAFMYIGYVFKSSNWVYYETEEVPPYTNYATDYGKLYPTGENCSMFAHWNPTEWYNTKCSNDYPTLCEINL